MSKNAMIESTTVCRDSRTHARVLGVVINTPGLTAVEGAMPANKNVSGRVHPVPVSHLRRGLRGPVASRFVLHLEICVFRISLILRTIVRLKLRRSKGPPAAQPLGVAVQERQDHAESHVSQSRVLITLVLISTWKLRRVVLELTHLPLLRWPQIFVVNRARNCCHPVPSVWREFHCPTRTAPSKPEI